MVEFTVWQILWNLLLAARWTVLMTTWARSAHRPRGAQARSLRSGRASAGLVTPRYAVGPSNRIVLQA